MPDELRIGVFVCECGLNIAGTIDCTAVSEFCKTLPDVVTVVQNRYTCAEPGQMEIKKAVVEHKLNRVVVGSCTPLMHEPTFRACVEEVGMNRYLMEMANLREHCSWVHANEKALATEKAKDIMKRAVAKARHLEAQKELEVSVTPGAVVIGGGVAGMQAAMDLADAGHQVYLVERSPSIGGVMAALDKTYPTMDCAI